MSQKTEEQQAFVSLQTLQEQLNSIDPGLNNNIAATLEAELPDQVQHFIAEKMEFSLNVVRYDSDINYDYYIRIRCNDEECQRILNEDLPVALYELILACWKGYRQQR